jgi:hypothetical protein
LFLDYAARHPASIFAPKALVAALALDPPERDSIMRALDSAYATSPYTRVLRGEASPAYAAAEDSLAGALGVSLAWAAAFTAPRWAPPEVRPRGPGLTELVPPAARPAGPAPTGGDPARPGDGRLR